MKFKHVTLFCLIFEDAVRLLFVGFVSGCATMVTHVPGSNEFVLRWDASKLVPAAIAWIVLVVIVGFFRFRHWSRSRSALVQRMIDAPRDTWPRQFRSWHDRLDRHD